MSVASETVRVALGERSYDILIGGGLIASAGTVLESYLRGRKIAVISDETVWALHGKRLEGSLLDAGHAVTPIIVPAGEAQKSFVTLQSVLDQLFTAAFSRKDIIIAFGGGVVGDLAGFAASIYKRGCPFIQIPTTLLAQVDSSVGGKTAINVPQGKNLVGAFYQPMCVLADTDVLRTLPERQVKAGYAEVLKYGLLGDREFFERLQTIGTDVLALQPEALAEAIAVSCRTKARIVSEDEREGGVRALLNLGHTFGHALEAEAGYSGDLLHGEAVSAGMMMAFEYSRDKGLCTDADVEALREHLARTGLTGLTEVMALIDPDRLVHHMRQDKKNEGDRLTLILARGIGEAFIEKDASFDSVRAYYESVKAHA